MMNRFFTLLLAVFCLTALGQEADGWCCDPDSFSFQFDTNACEQSGSSFEGDGFVEDIDCGDYGGPGGIGGCNDIAACNYDGGGYDFDNGTCDYECEGCRIPTACNYNGSVLFGNVDLCIFPNEYCQECGGNSTNGQGFVTIQDSDNDGICDLDDPCVGGCLEGCEPPGPEVEISLDSLELWCNDELSFEDQVLSALQICSSTPSDSLFVIASVLDEFVEAGQVYVQVIVAVIDVTQYSAESLEESFPVQGFLENGECEIFGCTSGLACNFNPEANSDDGSCDFVSCLDNDGLCCDQDSQNYADYSCTICNPSDGLVCDSDCSDFDPFVCQGIGGCLDENACNYDSGAAYGDDSCVYAFCAETCNGECAFTEANIYFWESVNHYGDSSFPPTEYYVPPELECFFYSEEYPSPPNGPIGELFFNGEPVYEGVFNYFGTLECGAFFGGGGFGDLSEQGGGLADFGITDWNFPCGVDSLEFHFPSEACGEVVLKGVWNGEQFGYSSGCTSSFALNYSPSATCDDGSCVFEGCTDVLSCNFDAEASLDDGSCDYSCCPGPGCCSQGLFWDWELGQCFPTNPADINLDGCVQLNDLLDLLSAYGDCGPEESAWQCSDPLDYQGYDYATVQIGDQCWFAENLRSLYYRNDDEIPSGLTAEDWQMANSGATALIDFDAFGRLYNWYAVDDIRGICPTGWGVPTDEEWKAMEVSLGMSLASTDQTGWRGVDQGNQMKATTGWGNGTNASGFAGLPGGYRGADGVTGSNGTSAYWWSSSPLGANAWIRHLRNDESRIYRNGNDSLASGFSIRCLKNAE